MFRNPEDMFEMRYEYNQSINAADLLLRQIKMQEKAEKEESETLKLKSLD